MQRPIEHNPASKSGLPLTPPDEFSDLEGTHRTDATQDEGSVSDKSFSKVYGGATASLDYAVKPTRNKPKNDVFASPDVDSWSPSLQNVLAQPPAALPMRLVLGGMAFCIAFGAWATFGEIEEIGHAQGQLVPKGEPYRINPVISGKVARIGVKEGETVKAGQVLVELDNQIATSEVERLEKERTSYKTQLVQTQALIDKTRLEAQTHAAIADAKTQSQEAILLQAKAKVEGVQQTIASARSRVRTTVALLMQLKIDANAFQARREKLQPLTARSKQLQLQLQADALASLRRQDELKSLPGVTDELFRKLKADADAAKARIDRLKPLVEEGALPRERLADLEQVWRDRLRAITEAKLAQENRTKEQLFQAEQALRDRQRAIIQTQLQEDTSVKEQLFQAEQALRSSHRTITQTEGDLKQANGELDRLSADLKQAQAELSRLKAEQGQNQAEAHAIQIQDQQKIQQLEVQKTQLQAKGDETEKRHQQAKTELQHHAFTAPVDGVILSLNLRNPGEMVQPGQIVAEMAPIQAPLVLIAKLPNREAGFVKNGMDVKVKLDSYPYQDYGIVSGKISSISADAKPDQQLGAVYRVEVVLERHSVTSGRQKIPFKPGQTATADIIIRRRRIADVLLDPIKQMQTGGIEL